MEKNYRNSILQSKPGLPKEVSEGELTELLIRVGHCVSRTMEVALAPHSLTPAQYRILRSLAEAGGETASVLAQYTKLDRGALTRLIDRLEKRGMVERRPDLGDRRQVSLYLTQQGRDALPNLRETVTRAEKLLFSFEDSADTEELIRILRVVLERSAEMTTEQHHERSNPSNTLLGACR